MTLELRRLLRGFAVACLLLILTCQPTLADTYPRQPIDIEHYTFALGLSDTTDAIQGRAVIDLRIRREGVETVRFDLVPEAGRTDGKGMRVSAVSVDGQPARFTHGTDGLVVSLPAAPAAASRVKVTIVYEGIPAAGLRVGPNRYGERTFFSDNWPDLGRNWLPLIDHISDKATCEFVVTAPAHYQVVSNGVLAEETDGADGTRITHWRQSVPIAPWLYTLGVARFAVEHRGTFEGKPIQTWVYAKDRDAGFTDFAEPTRHVLEYYSDVIGPFAYEKLANIQSPATGGGMEAAAAIMYGEGLVTGERRERVRNVVIHEIAHQWWGNAVTEANWDDVWLSEGFATYFTLLFREHAYGRDDFVRGLVDSRKSVLAFHAKRPGYRIRHENLADTKNVTTSQQYQLGSWVLHMLRGMVGDEAFWSGIRAYYREHMNGQATTADFQRAMEAASGQDLTVFFRQWLSRGGIPEAEVGWSVGTDGLTIDVTQTQAEEPWHVDLPVAIVTDAGTARRETLALRDRQHTFRFPSDGGIREIVIDPDHRVLIDTKVNRR